MKFGSAFSLSLKQVVILTSEIWGRRAVRNGDLVRDCSLLHDTGLRYRLNFGEAAHSVCLFEYSDYLHYITSPYFHSEVEIEVCLLREIIGVHVQKIGKILLGRDETRQ